MDAIYSDAVVTNYSEIYDTPFGDTVTYRCVDGLVFNTNQSQTEMFVDCQNVTGLYIYPGTWPTCVPPTCAAAPQPTTDYMISNYTSGDIESDGIVK